MIELVNVDIKEFKQTIYKKYEKLFPENERKSYRFIKHTYNLGITKIIKIVDDSKFIGFMIANKIENVNYLQLDYFAILPEYQNKGYGTKAIKLLKEQCKNYNGVYIEVERVRNDNTNEDKIRAKRVKFYENIGFYKLSFDLLLFSVEYSLYILETSDIKEDEEKITKDIFTIYNTIIGEKRVRKYCHVLEGNSQYR